MAGILGAVAGLPGLGGGATGVVPPVGGPAPAGTGAGERTPGTPGAAGAPAFASVLAGAVGRPLGRASGASVAGGLPEPAPDEAATAPLVALGEPAAALAPGHPALPRALGALHHTPAPTVAAVGNDAERADPDATTDGAEEGAVHGAPADIPGLPVAVAAALPLAPGPAPVPAPVPTPAPAPTAAPTDTPNASSAAAPGAAPAALATRATARGAVARPSRDPDALAPALRQRLGRVVARMRDEFGHDVNVAEAGRSQARQDYLFAQGRTRPGPVVTWTRSSEHTRGRAVDVTIDGGWDDTAAFAQLQQVAREEGLHTLGARDPGHLELPRGVPGGVPGGATAGTLDGVDAAFAAFAAAPGVRVESAGVTRASAALAPAAVTAPLTPAPAGAVATVAAVAAVAQVAAVATVAVPGVSAPALGGTSTSGVRASTADRAGAAADAPEGAASKLASAALPGAVQETPGPTPTAAADPARHARPAVRERPRRTPADTATTTLRTEGSPADARAEARPGTAGSVAPPPSTAGVTSAPTPAAAAPTLGAVAAQRVADVLAAQEAGAPREVAHLTLRLDNASGGEDRIRVDLRRAADGLAGADARVGARIDVADLGAADRLAARAGELRDALSRHGLGTDAVQVTGGAPPAVATVAGAQGAAGGSSQDAAHDAPQDQPRDPRQDPRDPARHDQGRGGTGGDGRRQRDPRAGLRYDEIAAPRGRA